MLIKHTALASQLRKTCTPVFILIGQDEFLMMQSVKAIKAAWKNLHQDSETLCYGVEQPQDWQEIYNEANSYTIFSEHTLIDVRFNKKTFDTTAKNMLTTYLQAVNTKNLLLIQAPLLTTKTLSFCSTHDACNVVQIFSLNAREMQQWIKDALDRIPLTYTPDAIHLILQYTMGNHLACAQLIEKLSLVYEKGHVLSLDELRTHLSFQCNDDLFELAEATLNGDLEKAIRCVRVALAQKTETILVLWILTQEIRLLIQLHQKMSRGVKFSDAASQLKIWTQRTPAYQKALNRLQLETLYLLLRQSQKLDQGFKLGKIKNMSLEIEQLLIALTAISTSV